MENKSNTRLFIALSTIVVMVQVREGKLSAESCYFVRAMFAAMLRQSVTVSAMGYVPATNSERSVGKCACRAQFDDI